jgi:hypothetical protein
VNSAATSSHYAFDNAAPQAGDRFANLSALYDEVTCHHLDRFGFGTGWHCLEVGAGGGSIARFMSTRVGPRGHQLLESAFDVVHARAVLTFVPERRIALNRMIAAVAAIRPSH